MKTIKISFLFYFLITYLSVFSQSESVDQVLRFGTFLDHPIEIQVAKDDVNPNHLIFSGNGCHWFWWGKNSKQSSGTKGIT